MVMCAHGVRGMGAASRFERAGHHDEVVLDGGPADWAEFTGGKLGTGA